MSSSRPDRVDVVTSVQRRRHWTPEHKMAIAKQTIEPVSSVSLVTIEHGLTAAQLFQWCKAYFEGSLVALAPTKPWYRPLNCKGNRPQSNGMAESFVKTLKRDYAKLAKRPDSITVMAQLQAWFDDYNSYYSHSALGYMPPTLFREKQSVT